MSDIGSRHQPRPRPGAIEVLRTRAREVGESHVGCDPWSPVRGHGGGLRGTGRPDAPGTQAGFKVPRCYWVMSIGEPGTKRPLDQSPCSTSYTSWSARTPPVRQGGHRVRGQRGALCRGQEAPPGRGHEPDMLLSNAVAAQPAPDPKPRCRSRSLCRTPRVRSSCAVRPSVPGLAAVPRRDGVLGQEGV